jgi:hypothetical protein
MPDTMPVGAHLVGSVALDSVEEVFRTAGRLLGRRLKRIPDGEPGGRRLWISWQYPLLRANAYLRDPALNQSGMFPKLALAEGVKGPDIRFGELGYAREARASYQDFLAAKARGELSAATRFQVSLPTPMAVIVPFCVGQDVAAIEPAYEKAMLAEVAALCSAIPHGDLAIQWDVCIEMLVWDGQLADRFPRNPGTANEAIIARFRRLAGAVPADVELGFHLCYGNLDGKHFVEPIDAAKMVEIANALAAGVAHPIAFLHMPVPVGRDDDAFFRPLAGLAIAADTELYLGIVHAEDGAAGIARRAAAARRYVGDFGIATECGIARALTPDSVERLLKIHAEGSREPTA